MQIELKNKILNDKYTEYIYNTFDIQNREETIFTIPVNLSEINNFDWNIGLIFGGSGTGKTSILNSLGSCRECIFDEQKPLISNFEWLEPEEATRLLSAMGLSSVPTWLTPYRFLSNGEQYRAKLAYLVGSSKDGEILLIDEYTSVVDRDVAKAMSYALQKYIKRENKRIVLASCHYDIMEWLLPDWTYSPQNGGFERTDYLRQRPQIELQVSRVEYEAWHIFKKHHYLTENVNKGAKFLLFEMNNKPVAICAVLNTPRNGMREAVAGSRIVVLPDYQGLGLGSRISDFVAAIFKNNGHRYFTKTVNPALGEYSNKSEKWKGTTYNGKGRPEYKETTDVEGRYRNRVARISYAHEYIGEPISGYEELLLPVDIMRKNKKKGTTLSLF
jgi:GNAT superfamily N-acetyltransferase